MFSIANGKYVIPTRVSICNNAIIKMEINQSMVKINNMVITC